MLLSDIRFSNISIIVKVPQPAGKICTFENRRHYGLLFVDYGQLYYTQYGKSYLSDSSHILLLPKGISYSMHCTEKSMSYVINFDVSNDFTDDAIQTFSSLPYQNLTGLLSKLDQIWTFKKPAYENRCFSILYEILARIEEASLPQYSANYIKKRLNSSMEYLEQHYNDPALSNDILAQQSDISTVYFRKLFHEAYGVSPMRYVQNKRMEKARTLLQSGYLSVCEIADAVGFNSIYHFSRIFKQIEGISPSKFALLYGDENEPERVALDE